MMIKIEIKKYIFDWWVKLKIKSIQQRVQK
jgi:hypothetical protein